MKIRESSPNQLKLTYPNHENSNQQATKVAMEAATNLALIVQQPVTCTQQWTIIIRKQP